MPRRNPAWPWASRENPRATKNPAARVGIRQTISPRRKLRRMARLRSVNGPSPGLGLLTLRRLFAEHPRHRAAEHPQLGVLGLDGDLVLAVFRLDHLADDPGSGDDPGP